MSISILLIIGSKMHGNIRMAYDDLMVFQSSVTAITTLSYSSMRLISVEQGVGYVHRQLDFSLIRTSVQTIFPPACLASISCFVLHLMLAHQCHNIVPLAAC